MQAGDCLARGERGGGRVDGMLGQARKLTEQKLSPPHQNRGQASAQLKYRVAHRPCRSGPSISRRLHDLFCVRSLGTSARENRLQSAELHSRANRSHYHCRYQKRLVQHWRRSGGTQEVQKSPSSPADCILAVNKDFRNRAITLATWSMAAKANVTAAGSVPPSKGR